MDFLVCEKVPILRIFNGLIKVYQASLNFFPDAPVCKVFSKLQFLLLPNFNRLIKVHQRVYVCMYVCVCVCVCVCILNRKRKNFDLRLRSRKEDLVCVISGILDHSRKDDTN